MHFEIPQGVKKFVNNAIYLRKRFIYHAIKQIQFYLPLSWPLVRRHCNLSSWWNLVHFSRPPTFPARWHHDRPRPRRQLHPGPPGTQNRKSDRRVESGRIWVRRPCTCPIVRCTCRAWWDSEDWRGAGDRVPLSLPRDQARCWRAPCRWPAGSVRNHLRLLLHGRCCFPSEIPRDWQRGVCARDLIKTRATERRYPYERKKSIF